MPAVLIRQQLQVPSLYKLWLPFQQQLICQPNTSSLFTADTRGEVSLLHSQISITLHLHFNAVGTIIRCSIAFLQQRRLMLLQCTLQLHVYAVASPYSCRIHASSATTLHICFHIPSFVTNVPYICRVWLSMPAVYPLTCCAAHVLCIQICA